MANQRFLSQVRWLADAANDDKVLLRLGRRCNSQVLLRADDSSIYLAICNGAVERVDSEPAHLRSYHFAIAAPQTTWDEFWAPLPRPGFHDIFALARFGHAEITGDLDPLLTHLPYFKRLFWLPSRCD